MSLSAAAGLLACPTCGGLLDLATAPVRCPGGHCFDVARQGYLNLLGGPQPIHADTSAMVAARERFLGSGAYRPLAELLARTVADARPQVVLEPGAGTGYYLGHLLDAQPPAVGVATDVSVPAARRAARAHSRLASVVADTWRGLPLRTGSVDLVCSVFAPRHPAEFHRVLRPGGLLLVVLPLPGHLARLRTRLGLIDVEPDKHQRWADAAGRYFCTSHRERLVHELELTPAQVGDLVAMGPNAFHHPAPSRVSDRTVSDRLEVDVLLHQQVPHP
ncbi:MAG: methyltransferase domain-containing protein [Actinomycetia bacterium]|nr:methyltransferase domain-containing protein [Actinomycetes bacterium]